ncbi:MAG: ribonuclease D [Gammaproteobacteria bacterium]|nr:ribonuclease D [Gammaproteobacteria bacterium]NND55305.1 ribonuclease D [Gammaproteobacteria bacterium]
MPPDRTPENSPLPLLINAQQDLDGLCEVISSEDVIALDTEFVRTRTYKPQLGLIQIAAGGNAVCIDPLAELDYTQLWALLFDPQRQTIMHSATQDLEVMWFHCGAFTRNLIDTQVCAALLGYQPQIGYAGLVADLAGVTISKEQTRTDWTRRPLSAEQIDYAAKDVVYLGGMHGLLHDRLQECGRYEWAVEDSIALCRTGLYEPDIQGAWRRIKSVQFLPGAEQARARALAEWREQRAVKLDKPRKWVMDDKAILSIAAANPTDEQALGQLNDVPDGLARRQGGRLLKVLQAANDDYNDNPHKYVQQIADRDADKALSKKLGAIIRRAAESLELPAEIVGSKREITALMRGEEESRLLTGWRGELVGAELQEVLQNAR